MISKFDEARDAFKMANKLTGGKDKDIIEKINQIKKAIYEREFFKSISMNEEPTAIDFRNVDVPASYDGPRFDEETITPEWCIQLMQYMRI